MITRVQLDLFSLIDHSDHSSDQQNDQVITFSDHLIGAISEISIEGERSCVAPEATPLSSRQFKFGDRVLLPDGRPGTVTGIRQWVEGWSVWDRTRTVRAVPGLGGAERVYRPDELQLLEVA